MYIYIMTNENNTTLYTGVTNDIVRRVYEHKNYLCDGFTKKYRLTKLIYFEETFSPSTAIEREKQIKRNFSREEKNNLIRQLNPEFRDLYEEITQ